MSTQERDRQKLRRYAAKRKRELVAQGYRYQTLALAGDVVACLEQVQSDHGFGNKAEAMNWLIRQAVKAGVIEGMAVKSA
ncbi:hypothetical protein AD951_08420 [Acetobacter malorum]|uniref:Uncharacterized protein n=1 Tax=Acetobacter malorum TaxID=178901 RepID=A0A149UMK0_9PROT|nr:MULTISPECIES: hypothetical protein [Acetobacter]KXV69053.1 hypothetical protein AD951_08420 [Acetobacter malorum]MBS1017089.1 hypothetical protein [Acetobacter persici]